MDLMWVLHQPIVKGAIAGALSAAAIDFAAFRSWKTWQDVLTYSWSLAAFRVAQGAVIGAVAGAGLSW